MRPIFEGVRQYFTLEYITTAMGLLGHTAVYLQAAKIIYLQSAYAVSLSGTLVAFASMVCWFSYGVSKRIRPLIVTNIFGLIGMCIVLWGIFYYGDSPSSIYKEARVEIKRNKL